MKYRTEIDGLRAIAVLPVMLFHAGFATFGGGFVGVDVFFVISGYLITTIIINEVMDGRFTLVGFYERRARRILPALLFVILACLPFAWSWMVPGIFRDFSQSIVAASMFASNVFFWKKSGYFDSDTEQKPLLHTWSLAVEEQFYLLFPLLILLVWKINREWVATFFVIVAVCSLAVAQWGSESSPSAAFYLLPARGWELLIGALVAVYLNNTQRKDVDIARGFRQIAGFIGLSLIAYSVFAFDNSTPFPGVYALVPTVGAALVILFATPQTLVGRVLGSPLLVGIGLISYSAYLWHQPLFAFARLRMEDRPGQFFYIILSVLAFVLAYFTWRYIERPFRDRKKISRSKVFVIALLVNVAVAGVGLAGHITYGYPGRTPPSHLPDNYFIEANTKFDIVGVDGVVCVSQMASMCTLRAEPDAGWNILLIGDSHSGDFVDEFRRYLVVRSFNGSQMSVGGCAFLESQMVGEGNECRRARKRIEAVVKQRLFDEYIIVGNYYAHTERLLEHERRMDVDSFKALAQMIMDVGGRVVVFEPRPSLSVDNLKIGMSGAFGRQSVVTFSDENVLDWKATFAELAQNERVKIFDQSKPLVAEGCGSQACFDGHTKGRIPLYRDVNHFTNSGAKVVFDAYAQYDEAL